MVCPKLRLRNHKSFSYKEFSENLPFSEKSSWIGLLEQSMLPSNANPPDIIVEVYPRFLLYGFPKLYSASAKHPFNSLHLEMKPSQSK